MTKYFATRSAVEAPHSDEEAAMQAEQLGPFASAPEARHAWGEKMARDLQDTYTPGTSSWRQGFRRQYIGFLAQLIENSSWTRLEFDGVRWEIRSIG